MRRRLCWWRAPSPSLTRSVCRRSTSFAVSIPSICATASRLRTTPSFFAGCADVPEARCRRARAGAGGLAQPFDPDECHAVTLVVPTFVCARKKPPAPYGVSGFASFPGTLRNVGLTRAGGDGARQCASRQVVARSDNSQCGTRGIGSNTVECVNGSRGQRYSFPGGQLSVVRFGQAARKLEPGGQEVVMRLHGACSTWCWASSRPFSARCWALSRRWYGLSVGCSA